MTDKVSFGAGCFWGIQEHFRTLKGVVATHVGYQGGHSVNPSYEDVCTDLTGHAEVVLVEYDPHLITFEQLLELFWKIHDPTTKNRQGYDTGSQYRSAIFCYTPEQLHKALASKAEKSKTLKGIVTEIVMAPPFYIAEGYHQCYLQKKRTQ